ncbi:MAG: cellobiose phosphorylase [Firmicutes bacterium]|nr:cellobiose phosphorylase [Bacillota bacterium]
MKNRMNFINDQADFRIRRPEEISYLYFPLASEVGLKSSVTPLLGGDAKITQNSFLLSPTSSENLHNDRSTRNFWIRIQDPSDEMKVWSLTGASAKQEAERFTKEQEDSELTAGLMWQNLKRFAPELGIAGEVTSFIPVRDNAEIHIVRLFNTSEKPLTFDLVAAIPIYGRSADNIRDHRNVTSMLHRIRTSAYGVKVKPTMSFDERGHQLNRLTYYVQGTMEEGEAPVGFYPTVQSFIGEGGTFTRPRAVYEDLPCVEEWQEFAGTEAVGGLRFAPVTLSPNTAVSYIIMAGIEEDPEKINEKIDRFGTAEKALAALEETKAYWQDKVNIRYQSGKPDFDRWMRWVSFQPILRRIFGCSFLPHHDYGRGGRGWRDLWQDCLSLVLMDPGEVRSMIVSNYGGVRIDGTNATIIGDGQGEFIADRNGISRVWMDHAYWPLMTTKLYIDQSGDLDVLLEEAPYFKDAMAVRGFASDDEWAPQQGSNQLDAEGKLYKGTILEHLLVQNLCAFYEVGEHGNILLRGADWNDALDMASRNGESVAFTFAYAGNLRCLAELLRQLKEKKGTTEVTMLQEMTMLLHQDPRFYLNPKDKEMQLLTYTRNCMHTVSGYQVRVPVEELIDDLEKKAASMEEHLRNEEWLPEGWYNSYYDDHARRVEGTFTSEKSEANVRMMLTGQVFAIMSGIATEEQIRSICENADKYLYDPDNGGYRLNTDFHELKMDMGRMFGFAYGEKENGAVFSHMAVMYANALYTRGFAKEGYKVLKALSDQALDFEKSRIYPGLPEYFDQTGRGVYHYLSGSASWYLMTVLREQYGIQSNLGDLILKPQLQKEQFDQEGKASVSFVFAGKPVTVVYQLGEKDEPAGKKEGYRIPRSEIEAFPEEGGQIVIDLSL